MANILFIDDDEVLLKVVSVLLKGRGHSIATATSGPDGIRLLNKMDFDLVICDANLPVRSGYEVVTEIRKVSKYKRLPIIFMTGLRELNDIYCAINAGFNR